MSISNLTHKLEVDTQVSCQQLFTAVLPSLNGDRDLDCVSIVCAQSSNPHTTTEPTIFDARASFSVFYYTH